jgi:hypothetical protein
MLMAAGKIGCFTRAGYFLSALSGRDPEIAIDLPLRYLQIRQTELFCVLLIAMHMMRLFRIGAEGIRPSAPMGGRIELQNEN